MNLLFKIVFLLFLCLGSLNAQGILVQGGLNNSKLHYNWNDTKSSSMVRQGFQIGAFKDLNLGEKLYFQFGLLAQRKGGKEVDLNSDFSGLRFVNKTIDDIYTLGIPLSIGKNIGLKKGNLFFQLGPIFNMNLFGIHSFEQKSSTLLIEHSEKIEFGQGPEDLKRFEFGSIYQAGYAWNSFKAGLQYEHGHSNLLNTTSDSKQKNRVLSFVFGYTFKKKQ
jgi:hypothetical protein